MQQYDRSLNARHGERGRQPATPDLLYGELGRGDLKILATRPAPESIPFHAVYKRRQLSLLQDLVSQTAVEVNTSTPPPGPAPLPPAAASARRAAYRGLGLVIVRFNRVNESLATHMASPRSPLLAVLALASAPAIGLGVGRFAYALVLPDMPDFGWTYSQAGLPNTFNAAGYLVGALLREVGGGASRRHAARRWKRPRRSRRDDHERCRHGPWHAVPASHHPWRRGGVLPGRRRRSRNWPCAGGWSPSGSRGGAVLCRTAARNLC